jgi:hypothetical protein
MKRVPKQLRAVLDDSGLPWHVENGSKHFLLYVDGHAVTTIPHGHGSDMKYARLNTLLHVKRHLERRT